MTASLMYRGLLGLSNDHGNIVVMVKALFKVLVMDKVAFIEVIKVVVVAIVLAVVVPSREDWATNDDAALDDGESGEGGEVQQEGDVECSENCFVVHIATHIAPLLYIQRRTSFVLVLGLTCISAPLDY